MFYRHISTNQFNKKPFSRGSVAPLQNLELLYLEKYKLSPTLERARDLFIFYECKRTFIHLDVLN